MSCASRALDLMALYRGIAATRMVGVPLCHPALQVAKVGFEPEPGSGGAAGVLVTPWFMNLVWFPCGEPLADALPELGAGQMRARRIGNRSLDFIGAHEPDFGPYEACSLFSPMFEFADQAAALATAEAVLALLRQPPEPLPDPMPQPVPARRSFLFGRSAA